ncbi:PREDICTED: uncharacterized protein LOC103808147, partial [Acanthisitta chloris]|uniref:uncharacterized protein LOC103808147 n=1 Tax=Acanthisitta chloris TaxID=57068 RepID=UPI0004F0CCD2
DLDIETSKGNKIPMTPKIFKNGKEEFPISEMEENADEDVIQTKSHVENANPLDTVRGEWAEEVAELVTSLVVNAEERGKPSDLLGTLAVKQFSTKRQSLKTLESLCASENNGDMKKFELDLESLSRTHEELKETASESEEELHQTHSAGESVGCGSGLSLAPEKGEPEESWTSPELFLLDKEFTDLPTPKANEKKYSLSSLLESCQQLKEMASAIHEIPLDLIHALK